MLSKSGKLQSIEGVLKDLCLKLGVTEANHISGSNTQQRSKKLVKMALKALMQLDDEDEAALSMGDGSNISEFDRAANALSHRMGIYCPSEYR